MSLQVFNFLPRDEIACRLSVRLSVAFRYVITILWQ